MRRCVSFRIRYCRPDDRPVRRARGAQVLNYPIPTIRERLANYPSFAVVFVPHVGDVSRIGDGKNAPGGVVRVCGNSTCRVSDRPQATGDVTVTYPTTDRVGDLTDPIAAISEREGPSRRLDEARDIARAISLDR